MPGIGTVVEAIRDYEEWRVYSTVESSLIASNHVINSTFFSRLMTNISNLLASNATVIFNHQQLDTVVQIRTFGESYTISQAFYPSYILKQVASYSDLAFYTVTEVVVPIRYASLEVAVHEALAFYACNCTTNMQTLINKTLVEFDLSNVSTQMFRSNATISVSVSAYDCTLQFVYGFCPVYSYKVIFYGNR